MADSGCRASLVKSTIEGIQRGALHFGGTIKAPVAGHQLVLLVPFVDRVGPLPHQVADQEVLHLHEVLFEGRRHERLELDVREVQKPHLNVVHSHQIGRLFPSNALDVQNKVNRLNRIQ